MARLDGWQKPFVVLLLCAGAVIASPAQVFKTLVSFDGSNGSFPSNVSLVQGFDGKLYGTTFGGNRPSFPGTTFNVTTGGVVTTLDIFCGSCQYGSSPIAGLVLAGDGTFYGSTCGFDADRNEGTLFRMEANGTGRVLHRFRNADGDDPFGALVLADDDNLYGTTYYGGGSNNCSFGCGTIFKLTPEGTLTRLHRFDSNDGGGPIGTLIQGTNGYLYGTTYYGGVNNYGTVFRVTKNGELTTLHNFQCSDGAYPSGPLIEASDGNLYGTTYSGGVSCSGGYAQGTVFKMTPEGTLTTLHSFAGYPTDGAQPIAGLIEATDGNFYGTASNGGANFEGGTVFEISSSGALTTLHNFCAVGAACADGLEPSGGLVQSTNGILYGTTQLGGTSDDGAIYSLDTELQPFVSFVRSSGRVGDVRPILGQGFSAAMGVSFNGLPASFSIVNGNLIRATVPAGATTGYVTVTTKGGTLTSNVPFHVIP